LWSPLLPEALWSTEQRLRGGTAQVYLDVSGSMDAEMPLIIGLLARLGSFIRKPLWAFSDVVAKAKIVNGRLLADTTGGTSMACVLEHIAETRPAAAVVVTDGYIETLSPGLLAGVRGTRLHVIVTRDGSPAMLHQAGISYSQLSELPT
jgi:predicted metal-dependent peptidase